MMTPTILDITKMINTIPVDIKSIDLSQQLQPVLDLMVDLDAATQSAILYHDIKSRFSLTNNDIKAYERTLKSLVKENKAYNDKPKYESLNIIPKQIHLIRCNDDKIKYLVDVNGVMQIQETYEINDKVCIPTQETYKCIKNLPYEDIITKEYAYDPARLLKDVELFLYQHLELPNNKGYMIPALWCMHTYIVDLLGKGATSPIMVFHGLKASGKTRAKDVLIEIVFRAFGLLHPSEANMYILPEMYKPTMMIDEITLFGKHPKEDLANIIKTRYKEGGFVARMRTDKPGNTADKMEFPCVFGATLFSTTERLGEYIDDRSIEFLMLKNERPEVERKIDYAAAEELCNRLLYFRHHWMNKPIPEFESVARRRQGEILNPLYQLLMMCDPSPERISEFKEFIHIMEATKKELEYDSKQSEIFRAILDVMKTKGKHEFSTKEVVIHLNKGIKESDPHKFNDTWVGTKIRNMGFERNKLIKTSRVFTPDDKLLYSLSERFGVIDKSEPELPFTIPETPKTDTDNPF